MGIKETPMPKPEVRSTILAEPKLLFSPQAYGDIFALTQMARDEISGLGHAHTDDDGNVIIDKIVLLKQQASAAHATLDQQAVADYMLGLMEVEEAGWEGSLKSLCVWWHSHANMDVFWSGTDQGTISRFMQASDWLVSVVVNKKKQILGRIDWKRPRITINNVGVYIHTTPDEQRVAVLRERFDELVTEHIFPAVTEEIESLLSDDGDGLVVTRTWNEDGHGSSQEDIPFKPPHNITSYDALKEMLEMTRTNGNWKICVGCARTLWGNSSDLGVCLGCVTGEIGEWLDRLDHEGFFAGDLTGEEQ